VGILVGLRMPHEKQVKLVRIRRLVCRVCKFSFYRKFDFIFIFILFLFVSSQCYARVLVVFLQV